MQESRVLGLGKLDLRVLQKKQAGSTGITLQQRSNQLHGNAARWSEALLPKGFVISKKPKKKKKTISVLKKRILMVSFTEIFCL